MGGIKGGRERMCNELRPLIRSEVGGAAGETERAALWTHKQYQSQPAGGVISEPQEVQV